MTAVPAHEILRTSICKIYGCQHEAVATAGPYAYLCGEHTEIARRKRAEPGGREDQPRGEPPVRQASRLPTGPLAAWSAPHAR